jgi:hypothetical protein
MTVGCPTGGFADERARDDHVQGWTDCLDRLAGWLAADRD